MNSLYKVSGRLVLTVPRFSVWPMYWEKHEIALTCYVQLHDMLSQKDVHFLTLPERLAKETSQI